MKRALLAVAAAAAVALACTGGGGNQTAGISGVSDVAQLGDLLFITATNNNELRVLDVTTNKFVTAPNPLFALSIPVADRPVQLAAQVGGGTTHPLLFARSANGNEISIVGAWRDSLRELARLNSGEEITAIASSGTDTGATLYVATFDGRRAHVRTLELTVDDQGALTLPPAPTSSPDDRVVAATLNTNQDLFTGTAGESSSLDCSVVESMAVMPDRSGVANSPPTPLELAYSVRRTPSLETVCAPSVGADPATFGAKLRREASFLYAFDQGTQTLLDFGGPVRKIIPSPGFTLQDADPSPPGARIFGILDDQSCPPGAVACRGVVAVNGPGLSLPPTEFVAKDPTELPCGGATGTEVGSYSCDITGYPMPPIDPGGPLITDVAIGKASISGAAVPANPITFAGVITRSDGILQFFDAAKLQAASTSNPAASVSSVTAGNFQNPNAPAPLGDLGNLAVATGAARNEVIRVVFEGTLPGFSGLVPPAGTTTISVPVDPTGIVESNDVVEPDPIPGCEGVAQTFTVTATAATEGGGGTVTVSPGVPAMFPATCTVRIRPSTTSDRPWVVTGTASGYLGRAKEDAEFPSAGDPAKSALRYFFHPDDFNPATPQIKFTIPAQTGPLDMGSAYLINTSSGYTAAAAAVDASRFTASPRLTDFASSVIFRAPAENTPDTLYVAYPSGNTVISLNADTIVVPNSVSPAAMPFR